MELTSIQLLILEDNPSDVELILHEVRAGGFDPQWNVVCSRGDYLTQLNEPIDIILSDFSMPQFSAPEALKILRERRLDIPFIVISGTIGEDKAVEVMREGASDYLLKDRLSRLGIAMVNAMNKRDLIRRSKKTEDALKKMYQAVDQSADSIIMTDSRGRIEYANPAFLKNTGYTLVELIGNTPAMLKSGVHNTEFYDDLWKTISSGKVFRAEFVNKKKNGELFYESQAISPIFDNNGTIINFVSTGRDNTERKKAEKALKASEAKYRDIFTFAPVGIFQSSPEGAFVTVNKTLVSMLGYDSEEELIGTIMIKDIYFDPLERNRLLAKHGKAGYGDNIVIQWKKKDGSPIWIQLNYHSIKNSQGETLVYEGFVNNITEQKRTEDALRISEGRYRTLVESVLDVIFTLSHTGELVSLNQTFEKLTGWKRDQWIGKGFDGILHDEDRMNAINNFQTVIKGGDVPIREYRIRRADGSFVTVEILTVPELSEGAIVGVFGVARDITERKRLEEKIRQSQKMESLGTLAGGIAHDFNNILGIILACTSMIERFTPGENSYASNLETIRKTVQRGAMLVRQILTFARKSDVQFQTVHINDLIVELGKMVQMTIPKTIEIRLQLDDTLPSVTMDSNQVHQAVLNLCVNARDAILDLPSDNPVVGTITITTSALETKELKSQFQDATGERYLVIQVSDSGTGMDELTKQRIFDPFFTTKEIGKGTGLGLAVVYGVMHSHHGFVSVESMLGKGTTFSLYFPLINDQSQIPEDPIRIAVPSAGGMETILLVEDEESLREMIKFALEAQGYTIITATSGIEGINQFALNQHSIDLVLSDYGLPEMDGFSMMKRMKELKPEISMILASGFLESQKKTEIHDAGIRDIIQKPFELSEILSKIRDLLDNK